MANEQEEHLLTTDDLARIFGSLTKEQVHELRKQPGFPKPAYFGVGPRWRLQEIQDYIGRVWSLKQEKAEQKHAKKCRDSQGKTGGETGGNGPTLG